ncbi:MAG: hypothetical protein CMN28_05835 [Salinisphaeraceae bacterium]|nr:hypothetical protein [Salinisphaeraceae bacterium]
MNTPAHAIVNLLFAARRRDLFWAVLAGALLPDLAVLLFYGWQTHLGHSDTIIWTERYFEPGWQRFFDLFNSLPLLVAGALVGWFAGVPAIVALMLSMALHGLIDIPWHSNAAHRPFYPFSDWAPLQNGAWQVPAHWRVWMQLAEAAVVVLGGAVLAVVHRDWPARLVVAILVACFVAYGLYALDPALLGLLDDAV